MSFFDFHHHKKYQNGIYNININEEIPGNSFSVGLHPQDIDEDFEKKLQKVKALSTHSACIAIGETGLDATVKASDKTQENIFAAHIRLANEIKKPVIIHCVRRFSQLIKFSEVAEVPLIVHGFNKKKSVADQLLDAGFYLSFGKAVLQNVSLQTIVKDILLNKIFLETDDADCDIDDLYYKVSKLRNISPEDLQNQIFENLARIRNL